MTKALTTLVHPPYCCDIYSSKFGKDGEKIEEGLSEQQNTIFSLSLSYGKFAVSQLLGWFPAEIKTKMISPVNSLGFARGIMLCRVM